MHRKPHRGNKGRPVKGSASMRAEKTTNDACHPFSKVRVTRLQLWRWKCLQSTRETSPARRKCRRKASGSLANPPRAQQAGECGGRAFYFRKQAVGHRSPAHGDPNETLAQGAVYDLFHLTRDFTYANLRARSRNAGPRTGFPAVVRKCDGPAV